MEEDCDTDCETNKSLLDLLGIFLTPYLSCKPEPITKHDSILTGNEYYLELMRTQNRNRFHDVTRMGRETFVDLLHWLKNKGGLKDSNRTVFISAGE